MADGVLSFSVHEDIPEDAGAIIDNGLGAFNRQAAPIDTIRSLACFAKIGTGEVIGGAVGRTWGQCCELQQLWVSEEYRHRGIGTQLAKRFEAEAYSRGCRTLYLETLSFQSPSLYGALGYETRLEIAGFPDGITKLVMVRQLP